MKTKKIIYFALMFLPLLIAIVALPFLPEKIPAHYNFAGEIDRLIADGYTAIFATSPVMLNSAIEPALKHPEVKFLCCSLLSSYTNIRTYYIRFYEAKFLLGMAAGILSDPVAPHG
jgi:hypothetical protein